MLQPLGIERPIDVAGILFGDEVTGPAMFLVATRSDESLPELPAHGHASDSWRMPLLGSFAMGRTEYAAGDFRFQRGWRTYPSDNFATGPDGGWTVLVFGDRRGTRVRLASAAQEAPKLEAALAEWTGIHGDQLDPDDSCPESTMVTSIGAGAASGHVDGSFAETADWGEATDGGRRLAGLVGDEISGPLVVLTQQSADACAAPGGLVGTDVVRIVVRGSCMIGDRDYVAGDLHVRRAGPVDEVVAGSEGLSEVVIFADRRAVQGSGEGWATSHLDLVRSLASSQPSGTAPGRR
jgi:hypothetical protein